MKKNKIINTLILIEVIVTFALLVLAFSLSDFNTSSKMDDCIRESALDEYRCRGTYTDYERHDLSARFEE